MRHWCVNDTFQAFLLFWIMYFTIFYELWLLVLWNMLMYGTCLVLCYGFRAATEMDALTHGDTEVKRNTGGENTLVLFTFFVIKSMYFYCPWKWWQALVKKKDPPIRSEILSLLVLFLPPNSGSELAIVYQSLLCNYVKSVFSVLQALAAIWKHRFRHETGNTFYCMFVALCHFWR